TLFTACSANSGSVSDTTPAATETGSSETAKITVPTFNADSAMDMLRAQTDLGPRVPGSDAHAKFVDMAVNRLKGLGALVEVSDAAVTNPATDKKVPVRNILATFNPSGTSRILLLAHYDTRPWADNDPSFANWSKPIDGANDGASGVAVLMELARLMSEQQPTVGVDILLTDAEDGGLSAPEGATYEEAVKYESSWCLGSRYWVENMPGDRVKPRYAILLDMVGGKNAVFYREAFSQAHAKPIVDKVWNQARDLGYGTRFLNEVGGAINDDHLPLLKAGIPAIDIIEIVNRETGGFNPTWHTLNDNITNIDPRTIEMIGNVVTNVVYNEK
ncbi:MAG: M28 family peptidase, partial [Muribaculaceae bacterium]|nr:M28 family peptidase [Muribaculaceae bacterium]